MLITKFSAWAVVNAIICFCDVMAEAKFTAVLSGTVLWFGLAHGAHVQFSFTKDDADFLGCH